MARLVLLGIVWMSMGLPLSSVMSVLIVLPGLMGSSMPTMISAFVVRGVRSSVARRVVVVVVVNFCIVVVPFGCRIARWLNGR